MDENTLHNYCPSCGISYPKEVTSCSLCRGLLETEPVVADGKLLIIPFDSVQCPACATVTLPRRNGQCAGCGSDLGDEVRSQRGETVRRRRDAFKSSIQRLTKRLEDSTILQPSFTREEQGVPLTDYIDAMFKPTFDTFMTLTNTVLIELSTVAWDPQDPMCILCFQRIVSALDKGIVLVTTLANQLPPIDVRAAHHILTRAAGQIIQGVEY